jgi:hypothetical protein
MNARSAWGQPATVVGGTTSDVAAMDSVMSVGECSARALLWLLIASSVWAQPATVVKGTKGEGAPLSSVPLVGVGSASHCGGGHDS